MQNQIPVVHPVVDYAGVFNRPIFGGELSYRANLTSLSRQSVSYNAITNAAVASSWRLLATADPTVKTPANCLLRGVPGDYTRASAELVAPFDRRSDRPDLDAVRLAARRCRACGDRQSAGRFQFHPDGRARHRPRDADGRPRDRYPFISVQPWGTQTIEPIAQLIVRPNETQVGRLPNEDAQSLLFDDANLFRVDKFSGWDRVEGGGRANVGVQATTQFDRGGFINVLFGQSYHLFGQNSFAVGDLTNTGINSG